MESFEALYAKLNPEQKKAVDAIEGPVMVIAGPGTGKTQVLTLRVANILRQTDTPPDGILALTFTESGVAAMRERLLALIGTRAYQVNIHTFHGLCNELIKRYPSEYPAIVGSEPLSDVERITFIKELIDGEELTHLRPFGDVYYYVTAIGSAISELKRENVSPEELSRALESQRAAVMEAPDLYHEKGAHKGKMKAVHAATLKKIEKTQELANVYARFEEMLRARRRYDYDDMIVMTVRALDPQKGGNEDFLRELQEQYLYILADEHQDANASQNRLLELLASFYELPNLFIVGDEKQAIFRFQGASLENFLYFKRRFPDAQMIELAHNYRSFQEIIDSAHGLMGDAPLPEGLARPKLNAARGPGAHMALLECSDEVSEREEVAERIAEVLGEGIAPAEVAILVRTNAEAETYGRVLGSHGIPYQIDADSDALKDLHILELVGLMRALSPYGDDALVAPVLYYPFLGIDVLDAHKVLVYSARNRISVCDTLESETSLKSAGTADHAQLAEKGRLLKKLARHAHDTPLLAMVERIVNETGFLSYILGLPDAPTKIEKLASLYRIAAHIAEHSRGAQLSDLVEYLAAMETYGLRAPVNSPPSPGKVRIMTSHRAKGLEFEAVFVPGVVDGVWGGRRKGRQFMLPYEDDGGGTVRDEDDERRLLYVALTRAKRQITISYSRCRESGRELLPSQFIAELDPALLVKTSISSREGQLIATPRSFSEAVVPFAERDYLRELFVTQGLSVTALNHYLTCPWKYFFLTLIRIPRPKPAAALYGTAIHAALGSAIGKYRKGEPVDMDELAGAFERALKRTPLAAADFERFLERGKTSLAAYAKERFPSWHRDMHSEYRIVIPYAAPDVPETNLRGVTDLWEHIDGVIRVTDFKTGSPKSRNDIIGATKTSSGDYFRQLVFYKLLWARAPEPQIVAEGVIDFVEPDARSGKLKREVFALTDDAVHALEEQINSTVKEIYDLSFWERTCDDPKCEFCALRKLVVERPQV